MRLTPLMAIILLIVVMIFSTTNIAAHSTTTQSGSFRNHLHHDNYSLTKASQDYGNIVHQRPSSVLDPKSVNDIVNLIQSSFNRIKNNHHTMTIAARGNSHSLRGQAMAHHGVVVNMTTLMSKAVIGGNRRSGYYADVEGGKLWIDVLRETLNYGLAPVSWTDYLYLTVGGTLSNAGISGQAFLHGPQIANVLQLDVVTGKGEFITCSKYTNPDLFFGVLGGLGQFGIITRARIVLQKAPKMTRWVRLIYSDFSLFTKDQEYLISTNNNAASYVEGFIIVNTSFTSDLWRNNNFSISSSAQSDIDALLRNNHGILYSIELAKYYDNQNEIDRQFETLLKKLKFIPGLKFIRDVTFFDFITRVINLDTPETGSKLFHPWLNMFVRKSNITDFNKLVLVPKLPTLHQTPDLYIFYPINNNKWDDRMSAVTPSGENIIYTLGLLHSTPNDYKKFDAFNNDILRICKNAGIHVKLYLPDYKTQEEWMNHFGPTKWNMFYDRKIMFDPKNILSPGQGIFN